MKYDFLNSPLSEEEQKFAAENHNLINKYLNLRGLSTDEWYDVVIFRYLRSVKRWFSLPDLHAYSFKTIVFAAMRSAISNEMRKQKKRIKTISLDEVIPGTNGLTYADTVTENNLNFIYYKDGEDMNIKYNVTLPERKRFRPIKSDEVNAIETFLTSKMKNMCFEYEDVIEAKKKMATIRSYRRRSNHTEIFDTYRVDKCIYIVRKSQQKDLDINQYRKRG